MHPTDRVVSIYRREANGRHDRPDIAETKGVRAVGLLEGLEIDWDQAFSFSPPAWISGNGAQGAPYIENTEETDR